MNNYAVKELKEMEFAILTVMMLLIAGVLMCYMGYLNSIKQHHLFQQLEMVEEEIEYCENYYKLKKLIVLRKKIKSKIDKM